MLRLKKLAVALALALAFAAGCASPIKDGEVISKEFVPEHDESSFQMNPMNNQLELTTDHYPDEWFVTIQKKTEDGQTRTRRVKVNQFIFDRVKTGEWYNVE